MKKFKVVLIDDDPTTNFLNKRLIEKSVDAEVVQVFKNGQEAINGITNESDIIFLDINMPVMNGFEFIEKYKESLDIENRRIVVMLSSSEQIDDKKRTDKLGITRYLEKPLTQNKLDNLIKELNG